MHIVVIYTSKKIKEFYMFDAIIIQENIRYGRLETERKRDDRREFVEDLYLVDNVGDRWWITIVHVGVAIDSMQFGFTFQ